MYECDVCGAEIESQNPPFTSQYDGQEYCFCCEECKDKFDTNPEVYASKAA